MKLLVALLVLMLAAQPVQAGFCDVDLSGGDDPHAAMQHGQWPGKSAHDCCPGGDSGPDSNTESGCADMPCGFCTAGVPAIPLAASLGSPQPTERDTVLSDGQISPSHTSPPFRPPIIVS